jgi:hypothetical protein
MNRKQFIFILVALAVIGSAGLVVINRHKESWDVREAKVGEQLLPNFRLNDVAAIHIKGVSDLNIENQDGLWRVRERGGYAANYEQIKALLIRMKDIKIVQSEEVGPSQRGRVELDEPGEGAGGGMLVEFKDAHGKVLDSVLVGKRHIRPETASDPFRMHGLFDGCYVLLPNEPENVLLISDELASISGEPGVWLKKEFYKIENVKSLSLADTNGVNVWTLTRETESTPWALADSKPGDVLDTTIAPQTVEVLSFLSFVDVVSNAAPAESRMEKPIVVSVETFDGFSYTLNVARPQQQEENYQVALGVQAEIPSVADEKTTRLRDKLARESRLAESGWSYLIESRLIEPLICERAHLLQKSALAGVKEH